MESEQIKAYNQSKFHLLEAVEQFNSQNDGDMFLIAAQESLEQGDAKVLLDILETSENHELLRFVGWDLVKLVFQFLPNVCLHSTDLQSHKELLNLICNTCNPREICLSLNELLSQGRLTQQKLVILLDLLKLTCLRLESKTGKILTSILLSLQRCFKNSNDIAEETGLLEKTLELVDVLVKKTKNTLTDSSNDTNLLKEGLVSFLIALLEHPFALLDLKIYSESEDTLSVQVQRNYEFAKTIVAFLGVLENGCLKRLCDYGVRLGNKIQKPSNLDDDDDDFDKNCLSLVGLGCLAYLTHVCGVGKQFIPVITTAKYDLDTSIVYINTLLRAEGAGVISKGLGVLLEVLNRVKAVILDYNYMDSAELKQLLSNLEHIMIHSEKREVRQEAVEGFRKLFGIFTSRGKYRILRFLYQGDIHSGFAELLNLILKEEIANSIVQGSEDEWFLGSNLASFLVDVIFKVPSKSLQSEYGIIEESDQVLSALNLLRFLLLRDTENKTTIHTVFPELESTYLKQLRDVVQLSRVRITSLVKEKEDEIKRGVRDAKTASDETILHVTTTDGSKVEQGSPKQQLQVLQSGCLTLDVIESILARIGEVSVDGRSRKM